MRNTLILLLNELLDFIGIHHWEEWDWIPGFGKTAKRRYCDLCGESQVKFLKR